MKSFLKVIGTFQLIGGLLGLFFIITSRTGLLNIGLIIAASIFIFSFAVGLMLLFETKYSKELSVINQSIQLISFSGAGLALKYFSPISIEIAYFQTSGLVLDYRITSRFMLAFNDDNNFEFLSINLVALAWIIILVKEINSEPAS